MILVLDNRDSFVHNVARYLRRLGEDVRVERSDTLSLEVALELRPACLVISPGPCTPQEAGISVALVQALSPETPVLGICLGHQVISAAFGGQVTRSRVPLHGRASLIHHRGTGLFRGVPTPFRAGRYHSLEVPAASLPDELEVVAWTEEGEVMALRHRERPIWGVQFHPESILTEEGDRILGNFLSLVGAGVTGPGVPGEGRLPEGALWRAGP